jgi:putative NIF3 family GTP cyclohydrolase 1 type 2
MLSEKNNLDAGDKITRREFVVASATALSASSLVTFPFMNADAKTLQGSITVQNVINLIIRNIPNAPYKQTVDTLKSGSADLIVSGIVTTMFPTISVIQKAIELKANFIIAHEPAFYNHADETEWLAQDDVYQFKKSLLEKNKISVWRCHDYLHSHQLDGVQRGVFQAMGWGKYYNSENPRLLNLPTAMQLQEIIGQLKNKLQIQTLRFVGDPTQSCKKIVLLPGAVGGSGQIKSLQEEQPDLLICGELQEWETAEYIRDALATGKKLSLVVLGHAASEEPGLKWLKDWLQPRIENIKVTHVPSQSPFSFM